MLEAADKQKVAPQLKRCAGTRNVHNVRNELNRFSGKVLLKKLLFNAAGYPSLISLADEIVFHFFFLARFFSRLSIGADSSFSLLAKRV